MMYTVNTVLMLLAQIAACQLFNGTPLLGLEALILIFWIRVKGKGASKNALGKKSRAYAK